MAKANYLGQIRMRMDSLRKEFNALTEAYQILSSASGSRGRKAKLPTLEEMVKSEIGGKSVGKRRGRPAGSKNKKGAAKPGRKPKAPATEVAPRKSTSKKAKAVKSKKTNINKAQVKKVVSKVGSKVSKKRSRIPDLSQKIQDFVGKSGRFVTNKHITDKLAALYPTKSRSDLGKYISVILSTMKTRKELGVVTTDAKGNKMRSGLWGLSSWFDNGKPKAEFLR